MESISESGREYFIAATKHIPILLKNKYHNWHKLFSFSIDEIYTNYYPDFLDDENCVREFLYIVYSTCQAEYLLIESEDIITDEQQLAFDKFQVFAKEILDKQEQAEKEYDPYYFQPINRDLTWAEHRRFLCGSIFRKFTITVAVLLSCEEILDRLLEIESIEFDLEAIARTNALDFTEAFLIAQDIIEPAHGTTVTNETLVAAKLDTALWCCKNNANLSFSSEVFDRGQDLYIEYNRENSDSAKSIKAEFICRALREFRSDPAEFDRIVRRYKLGESILQFDKPPWSENIHDEYCLNNDANGHVVYNWLCFGASYDHDQMVWRVYSDWITHQTTEDLFFLYNNIDRNFKKQHRLLIPTLIKRLQVEITAATQNSENKAAIFERLTVLFRLYTDLKEFVFTGSSQHRTIAPDTLRSFTLLLAELQESIFAADIIDFFREQNADGFEQIYQAYGANALIGYSWYLRTDDLAYMPVDSTARQEECMALALSYKALVNKQSSLELASSSYVFTLAEYVNAALYDQSFGYYASGRAIIGQEAYANEIDFSTNAVGWAPLVAKRCFLAWQQLRANNDISLDEPFYIYEFGAASGDMALRILQYVHGYSLRTADDDWRLFFEKLTYVIAEISQAQTQKQQEKLQDYIALGKAIIYQADARQLNPDIPKGKGIIISNELLDALPPQEISVTKRSDADVTAEITVVVATLPRQIVGELDCVAAEKLDDNFSDVINQLDDRVILTKDGFFAAMADATKSSSVSMVVFKIPFDTVARCLEDEQAAQIQSELTDLINKTIEFIPDNSTKIFHHATETAALYQNFKDLLVCGYVLAMDYGNNLCNGIDGPESELRTYSFGHIDYDQNSTAGSAYEHVGEKDITYTVNFTWSAEVAAQVGFDTIFYGLQDSLGGLSTPEFRVIIQSVNINPEQSADVLLQGMKQSAPVRFSDMPMQAEINASLNTVYRAMLTANPLLADSEKYQSMTLTANDVEHFKAMLDIYARYEYEQKDMATFSVNTANIRHLFFAVYVAYIKQLNLKGFTQFALNLAKNQTNARVLFDIAKYHLFAESTLTPEMLKVFKCVYSDLCLSICSFYATQKNDRTMLNEIQSFLLHLKEYGFNFNHKGELDTNKVTTPETVVTLEQALTLAAADILRQKTKLTADTNQAHTQASTAALFQTNKIKNLLNQIIAKLPESTGSLLSDSLSAGNYAQALRRVCTYTPGDQVVRVFIITLLKNKELLSLNINDASPSNQNTALHYAAEKINEEIYDLLCEYGADESLINADGNTARDIANRDKAEAHNISSANYK